MNQTNHREKGLKKPNNYFLGKLLIIIAIFLCVALFICLFFFESPKHTHNLSPSEYTIRKSGLQKPIHYPIKTATTLLILSICALFFYIAKLRRSRYCKKYILRLRRCSIILYWMFILIFILFIIQIPFVVISLINIDNIQFSDFIYSNLPAIFICLVVYLGLYLMLHKYLKYFRTTPVSVLLSHLNSEQPSSFSDEDKSA